ncbi:FcoT family thioesterase [Streptomyces lonarensis]|uniref:(2E)-enoyl-[ACP] glycyltransferase n=1 Tax=Streptomyces lonarensis TaxID=700599 RepID=A0A7X6HYE8_9ACTN|nr:FcoT family thioesterase [Streptomyces lonarensis]NJQ05129.1 hypothetical protein [Streptomyces lonarensis]
MTQLLDGTDRRTFPTDEELLHRVLTPYRAKRCEYLTSATVTLQGDPLDGGRVGGSCAFYIPESCYIDDTGHFNSVEFNICYNQMAYYVMAKSVKESLIEPFSQWTLDQFWARQLADVYITDFRSTFRKPMQGRHFRGEIEITDVAEWDATDLRDALVIMRTKCRYWDEFGGESTGEIAAAVTNPPAN